MKRSKLERKTPLKAKRGRKKRSGSEQIWKAIHWGKCECCGKWGRLIRHHICYAQHVEQLGGDLYDLRNALELGGPGVCQCHAQHHAAIRDGKPWRIPRDLIPRCAVEFAEELMGEGAADLYFGRRYA